MDSALKTLKKEVTKHRGKGKKAHLETLAYVSSRLGLLGPGILSSANYKDLVKCCRQSLVSLYAVFPYPALQLAAEVFRVIYHEKILPAMGEQLKEKLDMWESVLDNMLSGILDFFDNNGNESNKEAIGATMYLPLCDVCFSLSASMMGVDFRCTAYNLLSDCAASHKANQQRLRESSILGGDRIGRMMWRTKDFLALESLLTVFARSLPSTNNLSAGRTNRTAYIRSVFISTQPPEVNTAGTQIADMLEHVSSNDWDETASKIVHILSDNSLAFPQPFAVDEVVVCQQNKPSDRIFVDDKGFVANLLMGEDQYESLNVPYHTMRSIKVQPFHMNGVPRLRVDVTLSEPPRLGKQQLINAESEHQYSPTVSFCIKESDGVSLKSVFQARNLAKITAYSLRQKLSIAESSAYLEFDTHGKPMQELSQEERIENVSQFYHMNGSSDDIVETQSIPPGPQVAGVDVSPPAQETVADISGGIDIPKSLRTPVLPHGTTVTPKSVKKNAGSDLKVKETNVNVTQKSPVQLMSDSIFGASDEELSEISDADSITTLPVSARSARGNHRRDKIRSRKPSERSRNVVKNRRVLDSDDQLPDDPILLHDKRDGNTVGKSKKSRVTVCIESEDEAEVIKMLPVESISSRSLAAVAPMTPVKQQSGRVAPRKTCDLTEDSSDLADAVERTANVPSSGAGVDLVQSHNTEIRTAAIDIHVISGAADSIQKPDFCANADESSSKSSGQPRKAGKTNGTATAATDRPRGRVVDAMKVEKKRREDDSRSVMPTGVLKSSPRTTKRSRGSEDAGERGGILPEVTESQVLRPRATATIRATKRYRGTKGRTSSPIPTSTTAVDYDELPNSITTLKTKANDAAQRSSSPIGARSRISAMKGKLNTDVTTPASKNTKVKPKQLDVKTQDRQRRDPDLEDSISANGPMDVLLPNIASRTLETAQKEDAESTKIVVIPRDEKGSTASDSHQRLTAAKLTKPVKSNTMPREKPATQDVQETAHEKRREAHMPNRPTYGTLHEGGDTYDDNDEKTFVHLDSRLYEDAIYLSEEDTEEVLEKSHQITQNASWNIEAVSAGKNELPLARKPKGASRLRLEAQSTPASMHQTMIDLTAESPTKSLNVVHVKDEKPVADLVTSTHPRFGTAKSNGLPHSRPSPTITFASLPRVYQPPTQILKLEAPKSEYQSASRLVKGLDSTRACSGARVETRNGSYKSDARAGKMDMSEIEAVLDDINEVQPQRLNNAGSDIT
ncbi:hypothetical protein OBBRIDRAFT_884076 [Obba rivulosa]|uniref:Uncharacterized protein n=1 Tax=Obba rivulosa TaxID=1052685 RepID=A0A8E2DT82_9APHY|nr:hypothetical protein OBBRIDRAFT_884076 [Obba rivulosa]